MRPTVFRIIKAFPAPSASTLDYTTGRLPLASGLTDKLNIGPGTGLCPARVATGRRLLLRVLLSSLADPLSGHSDLSSSDIELDDVPANGTQVVGLGIFYDLGAGVQ